MSEPGPYVDPRTRNVFAESASLGDFVASYADGLAAALRGIDTAALEAAIGAITAASEAGRHIHAIGNGGSAAIADHLCCDFTKGTHTHGHPPIRSLSMAANMPLFSAIANDMSYEQVFAAQIRLYCVPGDVLVAVSSSGNSPNIVAAVTEAQAHGATVIGLSGFAAGNRLDTMADISLHVAVNNYGIVEDAHQAIMHMIAQVIARRRDGKIAW